MDLSVKRVPGMKYWNITVKQAPLGAIPTRKEQDNVQHKLRLFFERVKETAEKQTIEGTIWLGQMTL